MAAYQSPKLLVRVRVLEGMPNYLFDFIEALVYNISMTQNTTPMAISQVSTPIILQAAYGRRYKDQQQVLDDWLAGKDFKILGGPYCSIRDEQKLRDMQCRILLESQTGYVEV